MPDTDRLALFTQTRERLGQALARTLEAGIAEVAQAVEESADQAGSLLARRALVEAAGTLRLEAGARVRRALGHLYDLTFRLLELNQTRPASDEGGLLSLLPDQELDLQILADEAASLLRERLGVTYERWLRRIDGLTRTVSSEARAPLGAAALAMAAVEAFRPMASERLVRPALRVAFLEGIVPRLAETILAADAWLHAQGAEPWAPQPEREQETRPEREREREPEPQRQPEPEREARSQARPATEREALPQTPPDREHEAESRTPPDREPEPRTPPDSELKARPETQQGTQPERRVAAGASFREPGTAQTPAPSASASGAEAVRAYAPSAAVSDVESAAVDARMEEAARALVHSTQVADVLGRQPISIGTRAEAGFRNAAFLPKPEALAQDAVAFAHRMGVVPYTRAARQHFFESMRRRMLEANVAAGQLAALDLVGAMFDYVIDDRRMPEAARPLLWRLQQPAATLAALDAGFLGDDRRSVRRLVENLSAISIAYADDVTQGSELYRRLETVVRAVEVVAGAFRARSSVLDEQVRREYERASQGVAQLVSRIAKEREALEATPDRRNRRDFSRRPSREREAEVTRRLESALAERLGRCDVPDSVREFLLGVWLRHLRTAILRDGEDSAGFRVAMQVVDDLLWSLDASGPRQSRRQLANRIPPLIRLLTQGVTDSGARPDEFRSFLDELFVIHLRKMQRLRPDTLVDGAAPPDTGTRGGAATPGTAPGGDSEVGATASSPAAPVTRTALPALAAPAMDELPGEAPPSEAPPIEAPPVEAPPIEAPPVEAPPVEAPPVEAPPVEAPPVEAPPVEAPPIEAPPVEAPPVEAPARAPSARPPSESPAQPLEREPSSTDTTAPPASAVERASSSGQARPSTQPVPPMPALGPRFERSARAERSPLPGRPESAAEEPSGEQRLLSVLSSIDLGDFPSGGERRRIDPDEAVDRLERGQWLELIGRDGLPQEVKVAWINARRTVVLLVRRPDRRALSLRIADLRERFAQNRAALIG